MYDFKKVMAGVVEEDIKSKIRNRTGQQIIDTVGFESIRDIINKLQINDEKGMIAAIECFRIGIALGSFITHYKPEFAEENINRALGIIGGIYGKDDNTQTSTKN